LVFTDAITQYILAAFFDKIALEKELERLIKKTLEVFETYEAFAIKSSFQRVFFLGMQYALRIEWPV
jgi:hypothetical protein